MRVIQVVLFEFILGYILQGFSYYFGIYAFNKKQIDKTRFIVASIVTAIIFYVMRLLPISFGIHTIINSICIFLIGILYLKMPPLSTIKALLIILIFLLFTEFASVFLLTSIFGKEKFDSFMTDSLNRSMLGAPSSIIFALLNFISYYILVIRKRKKSVDNGENRA